MFTRRLRAAFVVLCLMAALPVLTERPAAANACPCNLFGNATPTQADAGPDSPVKLGTQFHSDVDGYITGLRFYKSAANTGVHVGELYQYSSSTSFRMGQVTFTGESASGWQTATFAAPIYIQANRSYTITYDAPNAHYAADQHYFDTLPSNGPLHVDAPGSYWGLDLSLGPTTTYNNSNYWVDPTFTPYINATSPSGMTHQAPASSSAAALGEMGTRFSSDVATRVLGVRYWGQNPWWNAVPVDLWKSDGTLLATEAYGDRNYPSGWIEVYFDTPINIAAGQEYVASKSTYGTYYFDTGTLASPQTRGNLHTPANAGVYQFSGSGGFPTTQTADNFAVEPILSLDANVPVSVSIDPSFTFSVANKATACNGESNFVAGAGSATSIALGHLAAGTNVSGGQALTVAGNAGNGFSVYVRGSQSSQNLRASGHNWTDVAGTYASPAVLGSGERFGYTYADSTASPSVTNPTSTYFVGLDATNRAIMGSATSPAGTGCISFDAQASAATPANSYSATVIYTAIPAF